MTTTPALLAGVARQVITPYVGIGMEGNAREEGSRGVHDDLYARALVLTSGDEAVGLVALDLCMLPAEYTARIRGLVAEQTGLQPHQVLVATTHTHAGPTTVGLFGDKPDETYLALVVRYAAGALAEAFANRQPAKLGCTYGCCEGPSNNRRLRTRDGEVHMNWEGLDPEEVAEVLGPTDPQIGVLRVDTLEGEPLAAVFNYALHPAILAGDNWLISADWPGYAVRAVEALHGGTAIFLNGGTGNLNHIDYRRPNQQRGYYEARRLGTMVGAATVQALMGLEDLEAAPALGAASRTITVAGRQVSETQTAEAQAVLDAHQGPLLQAQTDGAPEALFASELLKLARRGDFTEDVEVQAFRLGDAGLMSVPGEIFVEYQLQFKADSPLPCGLLVGYANGYLGYIPTPEALLQGGYEARPMSWSKLGPEAGENIVKTGLDLLKSMC